MATALFEVDSDDIQMQVVPGTGTMYYSYAVYARINEQQLVDILNEDFVSSDGEFTAEELEVASVYGSGSSNRYNSSQSPGAPAIAITATRPENHTLQQFLRSEQQLRQHPEQLSAMPRATPDNEPGAIYQYDENGNPLFTICG